MLGFILNFVHYSFIAFVILSVFYLWLIIVMNFDISDAQDFHHCSKYPRLLYCSYRLQVWFETEY